MENNNESRSDLSQITQKIEQIKQALSRSVVGQHEAIEQMIIGILAGGHVLIEGVPGIAKTLMAKTMSGLISADFKRIQFTPDLIPSDVIGTSIFNLKKSEFEFKKGPLFTDVLLIDEINRAPAKTQSALFEVMEERQVSVDGHTYNMSPVFFVLATQNPIEQEGTYRLPEAQLDRFLFKITADYPSLEEEVRILANHDQLMENPTVEGIMSLEDVIAIRSEIKKVIIDEKILNYIASITQKTRNSGELFLGASPRASIGIMNAAKVKAVISGRDFVIPEDVQQVAVPTLRHRLILSSEKEMEGVTSDEVIRSTIEQIEIPR